MSISAGNYSKQTVYGGGLWLKLVAEGGALLWRTNGVLQLNHFNHFLQRFILKGGCRPRIDSHGNASCQGFRTKYVSIAV